MPITPTFPGVYVEEIPSGVHTITGVATSIAAFVDTFERGLVNYAVHLLSMADFERYMGGLDTTSEASYAIQQFFQNGGTECYAVRVTGPAAQAAAIALTNAGTNIFTVTAGQMVGTTAINNPGSWGNNIRLEVDYNTTDPTTQFNLTITEEGGEVFANYAFMNVNAGHAAMTAQIVVTGRMRDTVVKTAAGWKIARRFVRFDQSVEITS